MKVKLLIIEDESVIAMDMADMLADIGYEIVDTVPDYSGAIDILQNNDVDIAIIDIMLGGSKDGIELAKTIRLNYDIPFIFLTSHSDKATVESASTTKPNGYLIKPFDVDHVYVAIETALSNYVAQKNPSDPLLVKDSLFIKSDRVYEKVRTEDILWLKAEGNYINVITSKKRHLVRSSFNNLIEKLPKNTFVKTHKSYYVNIHKIDAVNHTFIIINDTELPLSRNYKEFIHSSLNRIM